MGDYLNFSWDSAYNDDRYLIVGGAIICAIAFKRKSKDDNSYNVRTETARAFERAKLGSKSQLNGGGSSLPSETDSCHRRSMESEEKSHWVYGYGGSQTPPVSSSTKSSRCSSANTNRNSLLNVSPKQQPRPLMIRWDRERGWKSWHCSSAKVAIHTLMI